MLFEAEDYDAMKTCSKNSARALHRGCRPVYQQDGAQAGGAAPDGTAAAMPMVAAGGGNAADDVIDAEFTETK
jgi:molecular chaperone DnaK